MRTVKFKCASNAFTVVFENVCTPSAEKLSTNTILVTGSVSVVHARFTHCLRFDLTYFA